MSGFLSFQSSSFDGCRQQFNEEVLYNWGGCGEDINNIRIQPRMVRWGGWDDGREMRGKKEVCTSLYGGKIIRGGHGALGEL